MRGRQLSLSPRRPPYATQATSRTAKGRLQWLPYVVVVDLALATWYFSWLLSPRQMGTKWVYAVLVGAELFNLVQAVGLWWTVCPRRERGRRHWWSQWSADPAAPHWFGPLPPIDVLIPTYDEPAEIVEATLRAVLRLDATRLNVCLLDDGDRPEMADLAGRLGVRYIARTERTGAKAGNLNHALAGLSARFVAVFDCDHVPRPDFFAATMGYFHAPKVAYVQSPQYYANRSVGRTAGAAAAQQDFFYGAVARGRDRHGAMPCCGTNVVFRRAAIDDVGGFPERSLTEDFALSVRLHERTWQSAYVPEVLARGLGPEDMSSYVTQQARWAQGCVSEIPRILFGHLPLRLRAQYLLAASSFLSGITTLVYLSLPLVRIFGGVQPIRHGAAAAFLVHFLPYFAASLLSISIAGAGAFSFGAYSLSIACFWVQVVAIARCLTRRRSRFLVTPKQGSDHRQVRAALPALVLIAVLAVAVIYELAVHRGPAALTTVAFATVWIVVLLSGSWDALVGPRARRQASDGPEASPAPQPLPRALAVEMRPSAHEVR
jgi:cellulose synthase (UDP-forming)